MNHNDTQLADEIRQQIRDEVNHTDPTIFPAALDVLDAAVRAAVRRETARRPRVFFDGDEIPEGVRVITEDGDVYPDADELEEPWVNSNLGPLVELTVDYDAEVARARAAGEAR